MVQVRCLKATSVLLSSTLSQVTSCTLNSIIHLISEQNYFNWLTYWAFCAIPPRKLRPYCFPIKHHLAFMDCHPKHPELPAHTLWWCLSGDCWPDPQAGFTLTIPELPGDVVPPRGAVVQQCLGIGAVPLQAIFPQQGIEPKDQVKP